MSYFSYGQCILLVYYFTNIIGAELKAGDSCKLTTGAEGLCKYLANCAPALSEISEGGFPDDICPSGGTEFIVCCKDTSPVTEAPPPKIREIRPPEVVTRFSSTSRKPGIVSNKKCKEYSKYVWDRNRASTLIRHPQYTETLECPFEKVPLIIGGTFASRQEFPHMVLIGYSKGREMQWNCGGSLISENYVLTASHCLRHRRLGLANLIRVGMTNQSDTTHMQEIIVSEVWYHPEYHSSSKYHDIGLLKLSENVELNTFARPACLQTQKTIPFKRAIASGWGDKGYSGDKSNDLLKIVIEFFDQAFCNNTYKRKINMENTEIGKGIVDDLMLCAGSHTEIMDTCMGDSGGPLQVYHEDTEDVKCMYDIVGITSFGKACGLAVDLPGVYTRVSKYIKWIEDVVWPE